jgi:hypothetical protein
MYTLAKIQQVAYLSAHFNYYTQKEINGIYRVSNMTQYFVESGNEDWKELLVRKDSRLQDVVDKIEKFKHDIDDKYYFIWDCNVLCKNTFKNFTGLDSHITMYLLRRSELTCEVKIKFKFTKQHTLEVCISRNIWMFPVEQARKRIKTSCNENCDLLLQQFDDSVNQARQQLAFYKCWKDITLIAFQQNGHPQDTPRDETYSIVMRNSNQERIRIKPYLDWLKVDQTDVNTIIASFFKHQDVLPENAFQRRGYSGGERLCVFSTEFYPEITYDRDDTSL